MAYYGTEPWSAPARQPSWEQQPPPPRSGAASAGSREEPNAFAYQIAEVDKAIDNLMKSGKFPMLGNLQGPRRDSGPAMGGRSGSFPEFDPRMSQMQRPGSMGGDFDGRSPSNSNLQTFYANQRFGPRNPDADQQMQARRRHAAQRERELRNYHQEQQYQKHISSAKSDRSMSPNAGMSEEERRELIARQHRALYGNESSMYGSDGSRPNSQDARVSSMTGFRGGSPLAYDPFGVQSQNNAGDSAVQMPPRDQSQSKNIAPGGQRSRANSTSSPSSNPPTSFSLFENQQSSRTSNSSPTGGSPPRDGAKATPTAGVAPIGTRPSQSQQQQQQTGSSLQKRSTTPLPSPLSYGYTASSSDQNSNADRSTSTSSNPTPSTVGDKPVSLGWGPNSGVWGTSKNTLGVQASVWG